LIIEEWKKRRARIERKRRKAEQAGSPLANVLASSFKKKLNPQSSTVSGGQQHNLSK